MPHIPRDVDRRPFAELSHPANYPPTNYASERLNVKLPCVSPIVSLGRTHDDCLSHRRRSNFRVRQMQNVTEGKRCQLSRTGGCRSSAPVDGTHPAISSQPANMRIHAGSGNYEVRITPFCVCIHNGERITIVCARYRNPYLLRYRQTTVRGRLFLIPPPFHPPRAPSHIFPEQPSP